MTYMGLESRPDDSGDEVEATLLVATEALHHFFDAVEEDFLEESCLGPRLVAGVGRPILGRSARRPVLR